MTSFGERGGRLRHIAYVLSLLLGLVLSLGLFAPELQAQSSSGTVYTVERVPKVFAQDSLQLFSDPESYMSPNVRDVLNALLTELRSDTGVECAVVLLPSIGERDIEGFATELFRSWGIGSRTLNDGLLILLVLDQRKVRFEVGYGLEGTLPDATASRIQRQVMIPLLRQGHYADALIMGVEAVKQELIAAGYRSDRHTARGPSSEGLGLDSSVLLYLYILIVAIIAFSLVNNLQGVVYQAQRGQRQLLLSYPSLRRTYRIWALLLCVLCLPVGILYYIYMQRRLQEIEQRLSRCPHCRKGLLEQLSPEQSYSYLTQPQALAARPSGGVSPSPALSATSGSSSGRTSPSTGAYVAIVEHVRPRSSGSSAYASRGSATYVPSYAVATVGRAITVTIATIRPMTQPSALCSSVGS